MRADPRILRRAEKNEWEGDGGLADFHHALGLQGQRRNPQKQKGARVIGPSAEKVLDAPEIEDEPFLHLVDWGACDVVGVSLKESKEVYLWGAADGTTVKLGDFPNDATSLRFSEDGNTIGVGGGNGEVQLWDLSKQKKLRTMKGPRDRVNVLAWNKHVLASGSRDTGVILHDVRVKQHVLHVLAGHTQEVCSLDFAADGSLASGSSNGQVLLWDILKAPKYGNNVGPRLEFKGHSSAVRALGWCPFQRNVLYSGGCEDRTIRVWNSHSGECLRDIPTAAPTTELLWSTVSREFLTAHSGPDCHMSVWQFPSQKLADLRGHESRILSLAPSPDGRNVCTAVADETLRFWRIFEAEQKQKEISEPDCLTAVR